MSQDLPDLAGLELGLRFQEMTVKKKHGAARVDAFPLKRNGVEQGEVDN